MCDTIRLKSGNDVKSVKEFQEHFKVDAKKYGFDGNEAFVNCCLCSVDLNKFFKENSQHKFKYNVGDWWEE